MSINEVISIKYGLNTIAWMKSCIPNIKFKIYCVKIHTSCKISNVVKISGAQKPSWAKCLKFNFFYLKRQGYSDITRRKINWGHIIFIHQSYNEIVDKIKFYFFGGSSISLLPQIRLFIFSAFKVLRGVIQVN